MACPRADAFYSLHSKEAVARLKRLPKAAPPADDPGPSQLDLNFRRFRAQLEAEGFFRRSPLCDALYLGSIVLLVGLGTLLAADYPWLATLLLGVGMQQAGWIGHDYVHGRGAASWWAGRITGTVNGFSSTWWSDKHNTHHVYPNHVGIDRDITLEPVFYLSPTRKSEDSPLRRFQHFYFLPLYSILYVSWRQQSLLYAWRTRNVGELCALVVAYSWLFGALPLRVAVGSVLLGGFLVGVVVTATHQSEEMIPKSDRSRYDFVRDQFVTTRDAVAGHRWVGWLWGGMQYQLEHHLFPTMPKYYYGTVAPRVRRFAEENGLEYRSEGAWSILYTNFCTMRKWALAPPIDD